MVLSLRDESIEYPIIAFWEKFAEKFQASMADWTHQFVKSMKQASTNPEPEHQRKVLICGYTEEEDCVCISTETMELEYEDLDDAVVECEEEASYQNHLQIQQDDVLIIPKAGDNEDFQTEIEGPSPPVHQLPDQLIHDKVNSLTAYDYSSPNLVEHIGALCTNKIEIVVACKVFDKIPERRGYITALNPEPPDGFDQLTQGGTTTQLDPVNIMLIDNPGNYNKKEIQFQYDSSDSMDGAKLLGPVFVNSERYSCAYFGTFSKIYWGVDLNYGSYGELGAIVLQKYEQELLAYVLDFNMNSIEGRMLVSIIENGPMFANMGIPMPYGIKGYIVFDEMSRRKTLSWNEYKVPKEVNEDHQELADHDGIEDMRNDALEPADLYDQNMMVVDVGGGTGFTTLEILKYENVENVTVLDQSLHQITEARKLNTFVCATYSTLHAQHYKMRNQYLTAGGEGVPCYAFVQSRMHSLENHINPVGMDGESSESLNSRVGKIAIEGNHEIEPQAVGIIFIPSNEFGSNSNFYYSFNAGRIHFIMLWPFVRCNTIGAYVVFGAKKLPEYVKELHANITNSNLFDGGMLVFCLATTSKEFSSLDNFSPFFHLEDKVDFEGRSIVTNHGPTLVKRGIG